VVITVLATILVVPHILLILQIYFGWERTGPTIVRAIHRVTAGGPRISGIRLADIQIVLPRLPDGPVLAAHPINSDIPIFSGRHPLIYARMIETEYWFLTRGNPEKGVRRYAAMRFSSGKYKSGVDAFFQVLDEEPNLNSLILHPDAVAESGITEAILAKGFVDKGAAGRYRLFIRK